MNETEKSEEGPHWQILERTDRRVVGVLVEKAKTTPENYPLSLNALVNGSNQKSNRFPQMQLDEGDVEGSLDRLRELGAVAEIEGDGRVPKFRHLLYDWLGVDKFEIAVMTELLLRGAQTLGELRGRAARMEKIAGISDLRPIVDRLHQKGLIVYLTPPGRGCVVTHALYQEQELAKVRAEYGSEEIVVPVAKATVAPTSAVTPSPAPSVDKDETDLLRSEISELKETVRQLRADFDDLKEALT